MEKLKPCPFCGSTDIGIKDHIFEFKAGQDCPCSSIRKAWAYCRRCECEGRKTTIESVYDSEIIAAATEAWNRRKDAEQLEPAEAIENDSYSLSCRCPKCNVYIQRGYEEQTKYCEKCGQKIHMRAFTNEEIETGRFEREMDHYEDL